MGENSELSDGNETPEFDVPDCVFDGSVSNVEVLQESGKERRVNTANCARIDNVCSRQADGGSEFLTF